MKLILSPKHLARHLSKIDFPLEGVATVRLEPKDRLVITSTSKQEIKLLYHAVIEKPESEEEIKQIVCAWDKLLEVVKTMPDRPIMFTIDHNKLEMLIRF